MLAPHTLLDNRYRIIKPVGEGGMAIVYHAIDTRLGRDVAVKVLHAQYARDEPFLQRFQQEAEFAASLGAHPNIVAIYDVGGDNDVPFIVMEYVDGRSLKDLIRDRAPFSVNEAFAIGAQVASALDFAHKRGLVHRDVKPQNILVTPSGTAKVTDFGIARSAAASQLTRTGMVIGTVQYFSPEQAQGKPATPASDIYSLGIILYEMLTGHLPFTADTPIGVAMQHVHNEPPSPWDYNPALPARAVSVVMRALEKDPERRFRDAAEMAAALGGQSVAEPGSTTVINPMPEAGGATAISPVTPEAQTSVVPPAPREPVRTRRAVRESRVTERPARVVAEPETLREGGARQSVWLWLAGILTAIIIAVAAFALTTRVLGGTHGSATSTPTPTSTPKPKPTKTPRPHKSPTPQATFPVVVQPTVAPTVTAPPPTPTFTVPKPTATPKPPKPTATQPPPTQQPTPTSLPPTPVPTPRPPTVTSSPFHLVTSTPTAIG